MKEIRFNCPECSQSLEASGDMASQSVDCPNCNKRIIIPDCPLILPPAIPPEAIKREERNNKYRIIPHPATLADKVFIYRYSRSLVYLERGPLFGRLYIAWLWLQIWFFPILMIPLYLLYIMMVLFFPIYLALYIIIGLPIKIFIGAVKGVGK